MSANQRKAGKSLDSPLLDFIRDTGGPFVPREVASPLSYPAHGEPPNPESPGVSPGSIGTSKFVGAGDDVESSLPFETVA